jgi:hypothetical protein
LRSQVKSLYQMVDVVLGKRLVFGNGGSHDGNAAGRETAQGKRKFRLLFNRHIGSLSDVGLETSSEAKAGGASSLTREGGAV